MSRYILAIDQGTTGTTTLLISTKDYKICGKAYEEFPQIYPRPGEVEHNLDDIWNTVKNTVTKLLSQNNLTGSEIVSIGITNQRETTCAFNHQGKPLANAIVWQDRRTADFCEKLRTEYEKTIHEKTGLPLDPYFSGSKMKWLLDNNSTVKEACDQKDLLFGTIDTFLLYKLTGGESYFTEPTNVSRTLLYNINTGDYDKECLGLFSVKKENLPTIKNSFDDFGVTKGLDFLPDGVSISGILGDQQSALFGQAGIDKGHIKCTYGTGSFLVLNVGTEPVFSHKGLLTTLAYQEKGKRYYAVEGSTFIAGAAVQWLRDNLHFFKKASEIEKLAREVKDPTELKDLFFMPFFTGIGSPYWRPHAKGSLLGLTRGTQKSDISWACLEGITFSIHDVIKTMKDELGINLEQLNVDGGAVSNNLMMQMQSDISQVQINRPEIIETTGYGAGLAAAIGKDLISKDNLKNFWALDQKFSPSPENSSYFAEKYKNWEKMIQKLYT